MSAQQNSSEDGAEGRTQEPCPSDGKTGKTAPEGLTRGVSVRKGNEAPRIAARTSVATLID